MKIAMVGTRGVPAHYGGFETAVEEIGQRLVRAGHEVLVFRRPVEGEPLMDSYLGMQLVTLPAVRRRSLETLSHTALSVVHRSLKGTDAAILFNAANSPFLPLLSMRRIPVATHVDGLEWKRSKWGKAGRHYYRVAESLSVRWSDALIADAQGIADYYADEFSADSKLISYGAPILEGGDHSKLGDLELTPRNYHLVVARFEPENHVLEIVKGYVASNAIHPLIVVGSAPYANEYTAAIEAAADSRVRLLGGVWDQELLDQLYMNATTYLHGHSVGGTNPSLLRAAGAGAATIAFDTVFNREVIGAAGRYFTSPQSLAPLLEQAEAYPEVTCEMGHAARQEARRYDWDIVAKQYEDLCYELMTKKKRSRRPSGRRKKQRNGTPRMESGSGAAVLIAHPSPDLYGSDRMLVETVAGLSEDRHRAVVAVPADGPLLPLLREQGARTAVRPTPVLRKSIMTPVGAVKTVFEAIRDLWPTIRFIRSSGASTVLVNTVTIPLWIVAAKLSGTRVVCHVHEAEGSQPRIIKALMYAPLLLTDHLLVNSNFSLDVMAGAWPKLRSKATVVLNGVAGPENPLAPVREDLADGVNLLFIGRLSPRKGPQVAISALAALRAQGLNAKLRLLGAVFPGYEWFERELVEQVVSLGLQDSVEFLGFRTNVWEIFDIADIVLVPSIADEPFGNTAVEAMLAGRPLVVSETSGLKEAAGNFTAVRFVPPDVPEAIADAVADLVSDWISVREQVETDRETAEKKFSPERYRREMNDLVVQDLEGARGEETA